MSKWRSPRPSDRRYRRRFRWPERAAAHGSKVSSLAFLLSHLISYSAEAAPTDSSVPAEPAEPTEPARATSEAPPAAPLPVDEASAKPGEAGALDGESEKPSESVPVEEATPPTPEPVPEPAHEGQAPEPAPDSQPEASSPEATSGDAAGGTWLQRLVPEVHGFVSQGFIKSTANNYLANSEAGSFEFSEVGLNFTTRITDELRVGMQLFMRDLGPIGNYKPQFDWFYLDYRFLDWFGIRAGRTKIPFGLFNEVNDTDSARLPILLPQSLYPASTRDYLLAQTGVELYGLVPLGILGSLEYRGYGGTIFIPETDAVQDIEVPYVVGARLMWQTPLDGFVVGGTVQDLKLNATAVLSDAELQAAIAQGLLAPGSSSNIPITAPVTMWVGSLQYTYRSLLLAAEYGRWIASLQSASLVASAPESQSERLYGMAAWQWNDWLQTGAYYALYYPDMTKRQGRENQQHDVALTVRFDFNEHFLLKLEGHYMHGTAGLDPLLNDGVARSALVEDWGVFLAKTTAYF
jgi:hypothetical protein